VGSGPYRVTEWVPNDHLTLERNPNYWAYRPRYEKITWRIIKEDSTRVAALTNGEVDLINNVPVEQLDRVQNAGLDIRSAATVRPMSIGINMAKDSPFTQNAKVREALQYAVDRKALVDSLLGGKAEVMDRQVVHPSIQFAVQFQPYSYDAAKAKQLLTEAGFPDGISGCTFGGPVGRYVKDKEVGQALLGQMSAAGFNCQIDQQDVTSFLAEARKGAESKYNLSLLSLSPASFGMDYALGILYTNSPYTQWNSPELESLWIQARGEADQQKRADLYRRAQELAFTSNVFVHLYFNPEIDAAKKDVPYHARTDEWILLDDRFAGTAG
jgi:peptide/nickel transport system substrate-binding protein